MTGCLDHRGSKPDIFVPCMLALAARKQGLGFDNMLRRRCAVFIRGPYNTSFAATCHSDILDDGASVCENRLVIRKDEWSRLIFLAVLEIVETQRSPSI